MLYRYGMLTFNQILYTDPNIGTTNNFSRSYISEAETRIGLGLKQWLQAGLNFTADEAFSDSYVDNFIRKRTSFFLQYRIENIADRLSFTAGCRQEYVSSFVPLVYNAGAEIKLTPTWRITANASKNYRIPTLNDLYWKEDAFARGNPNLKPEWGWSGEFALHQQRQFDEVHVEASQMFFYNYINDWIVWQPDALTGKWQPENKIKGRSQGVDIRLKTIWNREKFRMVSSVSYQYLHAQTLETSGQWSKNPPDYVPIHKANLSEMLVYKNLSVGYIHNYTGTRYSLGSRLPSFGVADVFCQYVLYKNRFNASLQFRINNVWDKFYQVRQFYAMPLRNYLFTLMLNFSAKPYNY